MAKRVKVLTNLRIDEISSVDRGAGDGVRITLMKRDGESPYDFDFTKADLPAEVIAYAKRSLSADERRNDIKAGSSLSDGGFPIQNADDLQKAMVLASKAKDASEARAHIRARARTLGLSDKLSDAYKHLDVNDLDVQVAIKALSECVKDIREDTDLTDGDRMTKIAEAVSEFQEYLGGDTEVTKALSVLATAGTAKEGDDLMLKTIAKALGLKEDASEADVLKAIADQAMSSTSTLSILRKMNGLDDKATLDDITKSISIDKAKAKATDDEKKWDNDADDAEEKKKFWLGTPEYRAAQIAKSNDRSKLPAAVVKALAEGEVLKAQMADFQKARELDAIKIVIKEAGMGEAEAETVQKAYGGDKVSVDKLVNHIKALTGQVKAAGLFKEVGDTGGNNVGTTALDQLNAKADELRKSQPALTREQAFAKVYQDPANSELTKRERMENSPRAA